MTLEELQKAWHSVKSEPRSHDELRAMMYSTKSPRMRRLQRKEILHFFISLSVLAAISLAFKFYEDWSTGIMIPLGVVEILDEYEHPAMTPARLSLLSDYKQDQILWVAPEFRLSSPPSQRLRFFLKTAQTSKASTKSKSAHSGNRLIHVVKEAASSTYAGKMGYFSRKHWIVWIIPVLPDIISIISIKNSSIIITT